MEQLVCDVKPFDWLTGPARPGPARTNLRPRLGARTRPLVHDMITGSFSYLCHYYRLPGRTKYRRICHLVTSERSDSGRKCTRQWENDKVLFKKLYRHCCWLFLLIFCLIANECVCDVCFLVLRPLNSTCYKVYESRIGVVFRDQAAFHNLRPVLRSSSQFSSVFFFPGIA